MCEILGFSSQHKKNISAYLSQFYSHCGEHPNGTIFSGLELIPYGNKQFGDTDSERILMYFIDQINEESVVMTKFSAGNHIFFSKE